MNAEEAIEAHWKETREELLTLLEPTPEQARRDEELLADLEAMSADNLAILEAGTPDYSALDAL